MTYFKCRCCEAHRYSVARQDGLARDLCPGCGTTLDPVGELVGVRGYHSIGARSPGDPFPTHAPDAATGTSIEFQAYVRLWAAGDRVAAREAESRPSRFAQRLDG